MRIKIYIFDFYLKQTKPDKAFPERKKQPFCLTLKRDDCTGNFFYL